MDCLKFDIYAMVRPQTEADIRALLDEALVEVQRLNESLDQVARDCAAGEGWDL